MYTTTLLRLACASVLATTVLTASAATPSAPAMPPAIDWQGLLLSQTATALPLSVLLPQEPTTQEAQAEGPAPIPGYGHRGVSEFFNIREAYSDVAKGIWEFGFTTTYSTQGNTSHDFVGLTQYILYGITDDMNLELVVEEPLGYSGEGAGEMRVRLFSNLWHEGDILPAFGGAAAIRIPSGYGSSGVDGVFTGALTKNLFPKFRAHFQGQATVACGAQGQNSEDGRRSFQWSVGPGFDYQLFQHTLVVLNYLHKCSDYEGHQNNNLMEAGIVHSFPTTGRFKHTLKLAFDWTLDGQDTAPNFATKFLWAIDW